jgi:hypothetical protein
LRPLAAPRFERKRAPLPRDPKARNGVQMREMTPHFGGASPAYAEKFMRQVCFPQLGNAEFFFLLAPFMISRFESLHGCLLGGALGDALGLRLKV